MPKNSNKDFKKLEQEFKDTQQKLEEMTGISQRALADLQNYRRRVEEEKGAFIQFANAALFAELLPSIENIHRSLEHEPRDEDWVKGVEQTMKQIVQSCDKLGLKAMETAPGDPFDPNSQEALMTAPGEKDTILEVMEKGYMLGDKVLKPARVKVGNGESK
jgi:molecular chaperone GrpE